MKARRTVGAVVVGVVAVLSGACGDDDGGGGNGDAGAVVSAADLEGRRFVSTEVDGETLVDGTEITVAFRDGTVMVEAGCNSIGGGYTVADGRLVVEELEQTLVGCADELQRQDDWLADFLIGDPSVALDADVLTLSDDAVTIVAEELGGPGG